MADVNLNEAIGDRIKSDIEVNSSPEATRSNLKLPKEYAPATMNDAIKNKAYKQFYNPEEIQGLQNLSMTKNNMGQSQNLLNNAGQVAGLTKQQMELAKQRVADAEKQRAQMIGAVFGLAGTIGGAAIGGPAGAAVGSQAGQGLGGAAAPAPTYSGPASNSYLSGSSGGYGG